MIKKVEALLRNYKRNKSRIRILELNLEDEDETFIGAIDYSKDNVQTSNKRDLSDVVVAREKELKKLRKDVATTEALIDSLNSRKDSQYKKVVELYYIEGNIAEDVMVEVGVYKWRFYELCKKVLGSLAELL